MNESLEIQVRRLTAESQLISAVAEVRRDRGVAFALGGTPLRHLFKPEIAQLESMGNAAEDWSRVWVAEGFNPRRVRNCDFRGDVVLGQFKQRVQLVDGVEVVAGLSNSTLVDCVVGNDAVVKDVRLLANYVLGAESVVVDCGRITCSPGATFGNGTRTPVAIEGGGREVELFAELTVEVAALAARPGDRRHELDGYRAAVAEYRNRVSSDRGIIGPGARVWNVPRLEDSYVGPAARIDGAVCIRASTLLSSPDEPVVVESGAFVTESIVQWGCEVSGMAMIERSLLTEQASAQRHGKVRNSIIGPNSVVSAGEVSSCLLGPFVGCHHQSLLISTMWPGGRGNVGYGANVGSNHTSRAPDQEFWAGEGLFLGLGVNVKFPCDFSRAPYTVIACATNLPPQKVTFPFSLIAPPQEPFAGVPPYFNQISPAWMLRENIYALKRCEAKFRARNRATRSNFDFSVFRQDTVEFMRAAARRLAGIGGKPFYTDRDLPGLGKNVMTERDRARAIDHYRFYSCYFALQVLQEQLKGSAARDDADMEYASRVLLEDFGLECRGASLPLLVEMALQVAKDCERAREKDDTRGAGVIDDYAEVHVMADRDRIVRQSWQDADRIAAEVEQYFSRFPAEKASTTDSIVYRFPTIAEPVGSR